MQLWAAHRSRHQQLVMDLLPQLLPVCCQLVRDLAVHLLTCFHRAVQVVLLLLWQPCQAAPCPIRCLAAVPAPAPILERQHSAFALLLRASQLLS